MERLYSLPGKHRIYRLDNEGNFSDASIAREFARSFKSVFKNLHELIAIFGEVPGIGFTRETGVYEVERNGMYLVSTGAELFIVFVEYAVQGINYERAISDLLI